MMRFPFFILAIVFVFASATFAAPPASAPTTAPRDTLMDWLLSQSTTAPTTQSSSTSGSASPTSQPSPLINNQNDIGIRQGTIETSDGKKIAAKISTTFGKPIRVFDPETNEYRDIPFAVIRTIEVSVTWERDQPEWHFKSSGSDIKEYSGKTYPAHELQYIFTLTNGQKATGGVAAPIYSELPDGTTKTYVLHKRDKGEVGQTLKELIYVKKVEFDVQ